MIPDPTTRAVAFETGDIDLLYGNEGLLPLDTFDRFSHNPAYRTQLSQPIETVMLALNSAKAPTNELAVREALNFAVNKKSLIDNALYGTQQVADTLFAPTVPYADIGLTPRRYDPQQAKALLDAGAVNGGTPADVNPTDLNLRHETLKAVIIASLYHDANTPEK